jgi:aryl-alcohol dehydrogenase-like predicted oxidoreductase
MLQRTLGRSGIQVSAIGLGCWAIGGPFTFEGRPVGWGAVNDDESIRAIDRALDLGITFFDTADVYGAGHSERILGQALANRRDQVVITTKFGLAFDESSRRMTAILTDLSPANIRQACEASLRRLNTDYIDVYQLHPSEYPPEKAGAVRDALEELTREGKIRCYGWSYHEPAGIRTFAQGEHCAVAQHRLHVLDDNPAYLATCAELDLAWICNGPLAMGLLTGKFNAGAQLPPDDIRRSSAEFAPDQLAARNRQLEALRDVLTSNGRTLAQGALAWIVARSDRTIPIPGFKTVQQVEENAGALRFGPLSNEQMQEIDTILGRAAA